MKTIQTKLETAAVYSDDGKKRYLLKKMWDRKKPSLCVIMLAPSEAAGIGLDKTTMLVLNNADRLGYGCVSIMNLTAVLNDFDLEQPDEKDEVNLAMIAEEVKLCDAVVYAPGVGKVKNQEFQKRAAAVLEVLKPMESKLRCITGANGESRLVHPLTPAVREWVLDKVSVKEILDGFEKSDCKEKAAKTKKCR